MDDQLPSSTRPMTAAEFCRAALFFHGDKPDDYQLSLGHWNTPEPDPEKMTIHTMPRFEADMSVTVGELRRMASVGAAMDAQAA